MTIEHLFRLRRLQGRRVRLALVDGRRIDHCELVSVARRRVPSLWLLLDGVDAFVPLADVVEVAALP